MSARLTRDITSGSVAALVICLWELLITFDRELKYIWSKPAHSWIKWAFLFSRYFTIAAHVTNRVIEISVLQGEIDSLDPTFIRVWYILQVVITHIIMCSAEIVLMARVYALYDQSRKIYRLFVALILAESSVVVVGSILSSRDLHFQPLFLIVDPPQSWLYFLSVVLVTQCVILTLTILKYVRGDWRGVRLVSLLMRDGTITFGVITFISLLLLVFTVLELPFSAAGYAWFITFVSVSECRVILNMQELPENNVTERDGATFQLTTFHTDLRRTNAPIDSEYIPLSTMGGVSSLGSGSGSGSGSGTGSSEPSTSIGKRIMV